MSKRDIRFGTWMEQAWVVSRTDKPMTTLEMSRRELDREWPEIVEYAKEYNISVTDYDVLHEGHPSAVLLFYRDDCIREVYEWMDDEGRELPPIVRDTLLGLLFGYRSDAIQAHLDRRAA